MSRTVVFVVARAHDGVIGKGGKLPWYLPSDLKRFKQLTMGTPMIMGRKTFESFASPLPGRRHIVLTRDRSWRSPGAEAVHSPDEALALAGDGRISVIGGAEIFDLLIGQADAIELTEVHADVDGDTRMKPLDAAIWREVAREDHPAQDGRPPYSFVRLERI
ncbi:MAG TPA: dihydrofolate reductase [Allosphingosinicella sp.]|nr:dihydrofolate reductase [Allosphingosinicella sp.]